MKEHSADYRAGYQAGFSKGRRLEKQKEPKLPKLYDLSKVKPLVNWEMIEGDNTTFICPLCNEQFYSEEGRSPNFCWYCGAQSFDLKEGDEK